MTRTTRIAKKAATPLITTLAKNQNLTNDDNEVALTSSIPPSRNNKKTKLDTSINVDGNTIVTPPSYNETQLDQELVPTTQLNPSQVLQAPANNSELNDMEI